ncbi:gamma-glutamylcyclotransferase [Hahella sp. KA22]|uniref:gamma-glutamylcyclotransferase family protein n=1 Tax=Hahella sp. KA22 TaxID=1628392 RepID=UPI000FDD82F9|nr:gamma-glutamylcyclotransferase family protein [Hahella sp. KA22]AZZ90602.1 gamma-glutamylcyclotransferase [Hahella sp. KA22]QAY53972.1 gamma-glutamylcyclotransferase [Hahella sp. KA22]
MTSLPHFDYFAYGSNMSLLRLRGRTPSARFLCTGRLTGYQLRFHKVGKDGTAKCDIFHTGSYEDVVYGGLFKINAQDRHALDLAEGAGKGYDPTDLWITTESGALVQALTYVATLTDVNLRPFDWYLEHVLRGAEALQLPRHYIESLRAIQPMADSDTDRVQRELAIYRRD